jgi:hypothetical protein
MWMSILALALSVPSAEACAALVTRDGGALATSDAQQVILETTETGSAVEYANSYSGSAEDFGWIIVVPAPFEAISDGDLDRFERLEARSQPRIESVSAASEDAAGCGCAGADQSKSAGGVELGGTSVDVVAEGFTGTYGYTVVESEDADGLVAWLTANDWVLGANEAAVTEYVDEGGYAFVLVDLAVDAPLDSGVEQMLPPVRIESGSSALMFPARMARDAAPEFQSTRIFVLGDEAATITGGWSMTSLESVTAEAGERPEDAYEAALWDETSASATYARVFSGETDEGWLTRFETRADRDVHTDDVHFELNGGRTPSETVVQSQSRGTATVSGAFAVGMVPLLLPFLSVLYARRRD